MLTAKLSETGSRYSVLLNLTLLITASVIKQTVTGRYIQQLVDR